jgi:hypothetical protein
LIAAAGNCHRQTGSRTGKGTIAEIRRQPPVTCVAIWNASKTAGTLISRRN